jgi:hypothetical protein
MMRVRRVITVVRQINAVLILIAGILTIGFLGVMAWMLIKDATRTRQVDNVASTALREGEVAKASLSAFEEIQGSGVLRAALTVNQTYAIGSGSKEYESTRNYLFVDPNTRKSYWLRQSKEGLILQTYALANAKPGEKQLPPTAFIYLTVEKDTNDDKRLTDEDQKSIGLSDNNGQRFKLLIDGVDRLNGSFLRPAGRALLLYTSGAALRMAEVDLQSQELLNSEPLNEVKVSAE